MSSISKPQYLVEADMGALVQGPWLNIRGLWIIGMIAKWASPPARSVDVLNTDAVVAATDTWTFANGNFTDADVGGTFTVAGTSTSNGTFTIESVTNATTIVSVEDVAANETFPGSATLSVQQDDPTGAFTVEVSNDGPEVDASTRNEGPSGTPGPATLDVADITDPSDDEGITYFNLADLGFTWLRFVYTPTTGGGLLSVAATGKGP